MDEIKSFYSFGLIKSSPPWFREVDISKIGK